MLKTWSLLVLAVV